MRGFNSVTIAGNIVRDPELNTEGSTPRLAISVAVNYQSGSGAMKKNGVYYFDVTLFGLSAESTAKYKRKGDPVLVSGMLVQQRWDDKGTGQKRSKVSILAREVHFLNRGIGQPEHPLCDMPGAVADAFPEASPVGEDDILF